MRDTSDKLPVTVVILTLNEEIVVSRAISSALNDFSEVIVLDSFSTDDTVDIAARAGAVVVQNEFCGYASQRNFALKEMEKKNDWVFFLDADEVLSEELIAELRHDFERLVQDGYSLALVRRKDFFFGKWIRRSSGYPTWFGRLCDSKSVWVTREINEEYNSDGPVARFDHHILHYPFAKGISHWVDRHNRYSTLEAPLKGARQFQGVGELFSADPSKRRRAQKSLYMALPFRPFLAFFILYIVRGGFLDGKAGFYFARLRSCYEYLIDLKAKELRAQEKDKARP
jgi:glycosyltransferase involved in cell wall biosynthesis